MYKLCASCVLAVMLLLVTSECYAEKPNAFNPYMFAELPKKKLSQDNAHMASSLGGRASSLQEEVMHRPYWKAEVYPIAFGSATASHEILVFLDYALKHSENIWHMVLQASKSLDPNQVKIVVFAKNSEPYGTELMGGGIWIAHVRPQYALDYFTYSLRRWNAAKDAQAAMGQTRPFVYEYDAVATATDFPILYSYLEKPALGIPSKDHLAIVQYAFDAGNVNMYQGVHAATFYGVNSFPAIVINGEVLSSVSAENILQALR